MRRIQLIMFLLGAASLIASAFGIGKDFGEALYKTGIAMLIIDIVCIKLWPSTKHLDSIDIMKK